MSKRKEELKMMRRSRDRFGRREFGCEFTTGRHSNIHSCTGPEDDTNAHSAIQTRGVNNV